MFKPVLDVIRQANVESVDERYRRALAEQEYACDSCGDYHPMSDLVERKVRDEGEIIVKLICKSRCVRLGWPW